MAEYIRVVEPMECDFYRHMPPSVILGHCLSYMQCDFVREGCGRAVIQKDLGAVWMITSMRIIQYSNLVVGDIITYRTYPRVIDGKKYVFYLEIWREGEKIAEFDTNFMAVREKERHIVPAEQLENYWATPSRKTDERCLRRLQIDFELKPAGGDTIRMSDCDSNHHMTSAGYLSLACDALGFWDGNENTLMRKMQVDFLSEVRPGTYISFMTGEKDGVKYMQGVKPDGKIAFSALCEF